MLTTIDQYYQEYGMNWLVPVMNRVRDEAAADGVVLTFIGFPTELWVDPFIRATPTFEDLRPITKWCDANFKGRYRYAPEIKAFLIELRDDAMMFKLSWC